MKRLFESKIFLALFFMFLVFSIGVIGFRYNSGYTWIDAIYMTIITITTVGFKEVHPLGPEERYLPPY